MLIDVSYFTYGPRRIQNASTAEVPDSDSISVNEAIDGYIKTSQKEFLFNIVGEELAKIVTDYLELTEEDGGNEKQETETKYGKLCGELRDPFADYVFYHILRDMNEQPTMTGLVMLKCANAYVSPLTRQVSIWNGMVGKNRRFVEWAKNNSFDIKVSKNLLTYINTFNL